jgi:hypothetical protein
MVAVFCKDDNCGVPAIQVTSPTVGGLNATVEVILLRPRQETPLDFHVHGRAQKRPKLMKVAPAGGGPENRTG